MLSPGSVTFKIAYEIAARPLDVERPELPPSIAAILASKTSLVGFVNLE